MKTSEPRIPITVYLSSEVYRQVVLFAAKHHLTQTAVCRSAVESFFEEEWPEVLGKPGVKIHKGNIPLSHYKV